ncbi:DUF6281 family protein [Streptomyces lasiicapitis]|uniref:DUF6281 family protein n=1 Tax=Streptomyces lasiicapitis TaxID=1923961 RepID=UPI003658F5BB
MLSVFGCSSSSDDSNEGSGQSQKSCVKQVKYESRTYEGVANVRFTAGKELGAVTFTPCDDTGRQNGDDAAPTKSTAYAIDGLNTAVAIAVGEEADEAKLFAVKSGKGLDPELKRFIDKS